jgi:spore germination cell wall hydrolase CwlJ-like protein
MNHAQEKIINWLLFLISATIIFGYLYFRLYSNVERAEVEHTIEIVILEANLNNIEEVEIETKSPERLAFEEREVFCLAKNMYFEARGEPLMGRLAVAFVTMNRVKSSRYPSTVCGVIHQGRHDARGIPIRNKCHFSWYCDGIPDVIQDRTIYNKILTEARYVYTKYYLKDELLDLVEGATHYHADYVQPYWTTSYAQTSTIGAHIFYRPE